MIPALIAAAALADQASDRDQFVEIVVAKDGLIIRGERAEGGGRKRCMADVRWRTFDEIPHRVTEMVRYVNAKLGGATLGPTSSYGFKRLSTPRFPADLAIPPAPMRGRIRTVAA